MSEITLKVPRELLLGIIRCIPQKEVEELIREAKENRREPKSLREESPPRWKSASLTELESLKGIFNLGGDAVADTEAIYD